jgi:Holliday junction resolvase-like predicted endonuclease
MAVDAEDSKMLQRNKFRKTGEIGAIMLNTEGEVFRQTVKKRAGQGGVAAWYAGYQDADGRKQASRPTIPPL